jgi:hypothetical protein
VLGVEVLELRRVVVVGANRRRQKYTVREPRKMQGRRFATIKSLERDSQEASKRLQGKTTDSRCDLPLAAPAQLGHALFLDSNGTRIGR